MRKKLNWEAYTSQDRISIIDEVKNIINRHAYIINFSMFSDLTLSMSIGIDEKNIPELYNDLKTIVRISELALNEINTNSNREWYVFLNISFSKGDGQLKHVIPEVDS